MQFYVLFATIGAIIYSYFRASGEVYISQIKGGPAQQVDFRCGSLSLTIGVPSVWINLAVSIAFHRDSRTYRFKLRQTNINLLKDLPSC